ncbi:MAG: AbrB/MazE/SpoVT family DNA-binding domain-containing protein [Clostridia bacterium]|nr:AbrB/MazE/SpoVT family DNA-binding domain-containing protein [Clostridia bacterium]
MPTLNVTHPFVTGRSQAIRIPKEYRFADDEELVLNRIGDSIIITPKRALASSFFSGASLLDDDFMAEGRPLEISSERETLD